MRRIFTFYLCICACFLSATILHAQGQFSGDLQLNAKFFDTDTLRAAANTPFYDWAKFGSDAWFSLNYSNYENHLEMGVRFDSFNNTDLFSGGVLQNNGSGIGAFYIRKRIDNLKVSAGYIYDQWGSGFVFRSFENRGLGLDNPLVGISAQYDLGKHITLKAIAGKLKNMRNFVSHTRENAFIYTYSPFIKGAQIEANLASKSGKLSLLPGAAVVGRTIDNETMQLIVDEINNQALETRFVPKYNSFAWTIYNNLIFGKWSIYAEYAGKSEDVQRDNTVIRNADGVVESVKQDLIDDKGHVLFGSIAYAQKGLGITLSARKINHFAFRTSPLEFLNDGLINFLPPLTRQNSLRLPARYQANAQPIDETALQADVVFSPKKGIVFTFNVSDVRNKAEKLFNELYVDVEIKQKDKSWKLLTGFNMVDYNRQVYEQKGDFVNTLTPFAEFTYKFTKKKSLRTELQYMMTERNRKLFGKDEPAEKQDLGDWLYGLVEYNIAPHYSFSASDMYNLSDKLHYYDFSVFYTNKANRFSLGYAKQVQGIICTGGVCRFEPAFSGVKFSMSTTF